MQSPVEIEGIEAEAATNRLCRAAYCRDQLNEFPSFVLAMGVNFRERLAVIGGQAKKGERLFINIARRFHKIIEDNNLPLLTRENF